MTRSFALLTLTIAALLFCALGAPPSASALWPAASATPTLASATATAAAANAHSTQTAVATRTTGVMTATAAAASTQTAASTPTPNPQARAKARRVLNEASLPQGPKLGELFKNLWNARQAGGTLTVATPGPVYDISAATVAVRGVLVAKGALTAQAITACGNSTALQFFKCALCIDPSGTYTWRPGAAAATQELALKPVCSHNETEVAYLEIPPDFTSNTTTITAQMIKQDAAVNASTAVFGEQ